MAARFDDEFLAEVLAAKVLPRDVIAELSTLNERLGPQVQAHLSAAYVLLSTDPDEALRHALEARRVAPRLAIVREALGIAYYHAEQYGEAMKELRAARRISGRDHSLPLIADCERALGHPRRRWKSLGTRWTWTPIRRWRCESWHRELGWTWVNRKPQR